ncbi:MAG: hypothetical protein V5B36_00905 [Candidatus Accumulibacter sp. UW25]
MRILNDYKYNDFFCDWISKKLNENYAPTLCRTIGVVNDTDVLAVVLLDNFTTHCVELSIASNGTKNWCSREFLKTIYREVFEVHKKARANMVVAVENTDAINLHKKLGHILEARLVDWFGTGNDAFLYRITKIEWLNSKWK